MTTSSGCPFNVEADISFIENNDPRDVKEQVYQGFIKWCSRCGKNATLQRLCNSLRQIELVKLAEDVEEMFQKKGHREEVSTTDRTEHLLDVENMEEEKNTFHVLETDV